MKYTPDNTKNMICDINVPERDATKNNGALADVLYFSHLAPAANGAYFVPNLVSGSDYSGSLVERSNYEVFCEEFAAGLDIWWVGICGNHGSYGVVISRADIPTPARDFLVRLEDYPIADEDVHSQLEIEAQTEAWKNWAKSDFETSLTNNRGDLGGIEVLSCVRVVVVLFGAVFTA